MLIWYNGDQLRYLNKQYMIEKENYLLYMVIINIALALEWNETVQKKCLGALNFVGLL